jgi:hypothetical protein
MVVLVDYVGSSDADRENKESDKLLERHLEASFELRRVVV